MLYVVAKPSETIPPIQKYHPITHKHQPNITQIHKYHLNKVLIHNPNWSKMPKWTKMTENWPKNGPKQPKMPPNGLKCLAKWSKWGKEYQHQIIWPKMAENCKKKNTKNGQNYPKMAKNYPKWSEMFRQMAQMRQGIPNCLTQNGRKLKKNTKNGQKLPKMVWNV